MYPVRSATEWVVVLGIDRAAQDAVASARNVRTMEGMNDVVLVMLMSGRRTTPPKTDIAPDDFGAIRASRS
jgi:hypothetical protein